MKYSHSGAPLGPWAVYFHGAPGAPEECRVFDAAAKQYGVRLICLDRFSVDASIAGDAYFEFLADEISGITQGAPVVFIGFSIGSFVALQTSRFMRSSVQHIHLISAAAPLEMGDYLPHMAGKPVFQLAQSCPKGLSMLSHFQRLLARHCPSVLFRMLFASAAGGDQALSRETAFQTAIARDLQACFSHGIQGYQRDVKAYVRPWSATLAEITADTSLWHGSRDNWSPPAMASGLASHIRSVRATEFLDGLSHYSCLHDAVPKICETLVSTDQAKGIHTDGMVHAAHP